MRLIAEYMQIDHSTRSRRSLFTVHFPENEAAALDWIKSRSGLPEELEVDDSLTLSTPHLPPAPYMVLGAVDYKGRYRYFYLYS